MLLPFCPYLRLLPNIIPPFYSLELPLLSFHKLLQIHISDTEVLAYVRDLCSIRFKAFHRHHSAFDDRGLGNNKWISEHAAL